MTTSTTYYALRSVLIEHGARPSALTGLSELAGLLSDDVLRVIAVGARSVELARDAMLVVLGRQGRVEPEHTRIIRSVPELDAAAVSAVSQWRFSPAIGRQGRPVRVIVEIPVQFSLK